MPSDATHVSSAKWISAISAVIMYAAGIDIVHIITVIILFMFNVMYLSPDLDMWNTVPTARWKKLKIWFSPFEKRVDHRSRWSHGWIFGLIVLHLHFLVLVIIAVAFLRLAWLPLIEPMIDMCNSGIDDLLVLKLSPEFVTLATVYMGAAAAAHWHHKILDILVRN